jgi:hypothetical protein
MAVSSIIDPAGVVAKATSDGEELPAPLKALTWYL